MSEWFKDWFDTKYYHILYQERNSEEAQLFIENLVQKIGVKFGAHVLDLACGKGRHSVYLNKLGFSVLGVDLSEHNIEYAKQFENENLAFVQQDMRDPIKDQKFDTVFNLFTSIGYFDQLEDNFKVFNAIKGYLKSDGLLVIDFLNVERVLECHIGCETKVLDGISFNLNRYEEDGFIIKDISFKDDGKDYKFKEKVQALSLNDFTEQLKKSNFEIKSVFGDYKLSNFEPDKSERLIIIASKV